MKLFEYKNEAGEIEYRTADGSIIPQEIVKLWHDISVRSEFRTAQLDLLLCNLLENNAMEKPKTAKAV